MVDDLKRIGERVDADEGNGGALDAGPEVTSPVEGWGLTTADLQAISDSVGDDLQSFVQDPEGTELVVEEPFQEVRDRILQEIYLILDEISLPDFSEEQILYQISDDGNIVIGVSGDFLLVDDEDLVALEIGSSEALSSDNIDDTGEFDLDSSGIYGDGFSGEDSLLFRDMGLNAVNNEGRFWIGDVNFVNGNSVSFAIRPDFDIFSVFTSLYNFGDGKYAWESGDYREFSDISLRALNNFVSQVRKGDRQVDLDYDSWRDHFRRPGVRLAYLFGEFPALADLSPEQSKFVMTFQELYSAVEANSDFLSDCGVVSGQAVFTRTVCHFVSNSSSIESFYLLGIVMGEGGKYESTLRLFSTIDMSEDELRFYATLDDDLMAIIN